MGTVEGHRGDQKDAMGPKIGSATERFDTRSGGTGMRRVSVFRAAANFPPFGSPHCRSSELAPVASLSSEDVCDCGFYNPVHPATGALNSETKVVCDLQTAISRSVQLLQVIFCSKCAYFGYFKPFPVWMLLDIMFLGNNKRITVFFRNCLLTLVFLPLCSLFRLP